MTKPRYNVIWRVSHPGASDTTHEEDHDTWSEAEALHKRLAARDNVQKALVYDRKKKARTFEVEPPNWQSMTTLVF